MKTKKIVALIFAFIMIFGSFNFTASALKNGDPLGDILYSDIIAYINGKAIPTSIKNGMTMVVVEDLMNYGFDVFWNGKDRTLKVEINPNKQVTPMKVDKNAKPSGTFKCKYVYTDIRTYLSGEMVESFAINGVTLIDFELLAKYGSVKWDGKARTISVTTKSYNPVLTLSESENYVYDLAADVLKLIKNKDWGALGHMVHPKQGLTFSPYGYVDTSTAIRLGIGDVIPLGMDKTVRKWGYYEGSGNPIKCAFAEYYDRFIYSHDFLKAPVIGVDRTIRSTYPDNLFVFGNGCVYVDFHMPGVEPYIDFTWASLRLVFGWYEGDEYYESGLYLVAIVHDQWTI